MEEDNPHSFSVIVATKRSEFISYREAITKLAEYTCDSWAAVAVVLKLHRFYTKDYAAELSGPARAVEFARRSNDLRVLLEETAASGEIRTAMIYPDVPGDTEKGDPDLCGWIRDDFITDLRESGLPCPETLGIPDLIETRVHGQVKDFLSSRNAFEKSLRTQDGLAQANDAALIERLRNAEDEVVSLKGQLEAQAGAPDHAHLQEQVSTLTRRVNELLANLDAANAKVEELSRDQAQGKTKTAMLRVIGGLVMANTDVDIHATRLDGLSKMLTDLQTVGVTIGEDSLRAYLKEAASYIEKPSIR
ncbi:hypothetical protein [Burkholderia ubonensis]|uniref:hypothetical protein n=1 Tax=Burkholderia ubonensis TaxID=101571 RepID=UPI000AC401D0|nr:hypothetical protein [Burkholderia ubonensis]